MSTIYIFITRKPVRQKQVFSITPLSRLTLSHIYSRTQVNSTLSTTASVTNRRTRQGLTDVPDNMGAFMPSINTDDTRVNQQQTIQAGASMPATISIITTTMMLVSYQQQTETAPPTQPRKQ